MTDKIEDKDVSVVAKENQPLTGKQKLMFTLICWGVQSWSQAKSFKTNGYTQKYIDSTKAMYFGLTIYGIIITLFILTLIMSK